MSEAAASEAAAPAALVERRDGATILTFNRAEAHNAINAQMREIIEQTLQSLRTDGSRLLVLRGAGDSFMSGADIHEFAAATPDEMVQNARRDQAMLRAIEDLPIPTLALLHGYTMGNGLFIAAACDLRICSSNARFGITSARSLANSLHPWGYSRISGLIGEARLKELIILARVIDADTAFSWGLLTEVVAPDELEARVEELIAQIPSQAALTMWAVKESMRRLRREIPGDEDELLRFVQSSNDLTEGMTAFIEKRRPVFSDLPPWDRRL